MIPPALPAVANANVAAVNSHLRRKLENARAEDRRGQNVLVNERLCADRDQTLILESPRAVN